MRGECAENARKIRGKYAENAREFAWFPSGRNLFAIFCYKISSPVPVCLGPHLRIRVVIWIVIRQCCLIRLVTTITKTLTGHGRLATCAALRGIIGKQGTVTIKETLAHRPHLEHLWNLLNHYGPSRRTN